MELGFDGNLLRAHSIEAITEILRDFVRIGEGLWRRHELYEGQVSPEETGPALSFVESNSEEEIREALQDHNYARFLSPSLIRLTKIQSWISALHPNAELVQLPRDGLLVIWDPSNAGTSKFLSLF